MRAFSCNANGNIITEYGDDFTPTLLFEKEGKMETKQKNPESDNDNDFGSLGCR